MACEPIFVDNLNNLWVNSETGVEEWVKLIGKTYIGKLIDKNTSFAYFVEVLNFKKLSSGNYRTTLKLEGTLNPHYSPVYTFLLRPTGKIIKKVLNAETYVV